MSLISASNGKSTVSLADSRQYCAELTKAAARNFYYGLKLLPEGKRIAMFALYAYMRLVDDIADGEDGQTIQQRHESLDLWSDATNTALAGQTPGDGHIVWPAFVEMVQRYQVPAHVFTDVIAGQRQDLEIPVIINFEDLKEYCYRVAGVVGVASIYIWGFDGGASTEALAIDRGIAFQLTNILRDLREDAGRGRTYLPRNEIEKAGITEAQLQGGPADEKFLHFMREQAARAQSYYEKSSPLENLISADSRPTLTAMTQIYHGLLRKVQANPGRVLQERISLSPLTKFRIAWRAARSRQWA